MKFGENLKKIRKYKKISQEALAEKVGVSRQSVSKWETGEAYPEMNNILTLCKIFNCHINDLVHEDFTDINSLDDEIKMSVVKFKKDQQKKIKGLSMAISVVARVCKIFVSIVIFLSLIYMLVILFVSSKMEIKQNEISIDEKIFKYDINEDNQFILYDEDGNQKFKMMIDTSTNLDKYIDHITVGKLVFSTEYISLCFVITLVFVYLLLSYVDKLFRNIYSGETPFTLDNIKYIKKIALYMTFIVLFPFITGFIFQYIMGLDMSIELELFDLLLVIVIISLSYIFEYGYQIQLDSKGVMYGEE